MKSNKVIFSVIGAAALAFAITGCGTTPATNSQANAMNKPANTATVTNSNTASVTNTGTNTAHNAAH